MQVSDLLTPTWVHAITIAIYIGLTLWVAFRFRNPISWGLLWLATNIAVVDVVSLISSDSNSILIPSLLYLGVAVLWLGLERLFPVPQSAYARTSFVVQALWMTVAVYVYNIFAPNNTDDLALSGAIILTGLTLGWLFPTQKDVWEGLSALVLIGIGMSQALVESD